MTSQAEAAMAAFNAQNAVEGGNEVEAPKVSKTALETAITDGTEPIEIDEAKPEVAIEDLSTEDMLNMSTDDILKLLDKPEKVVKEPIEPELAPIDDEKKSSIMIPKPRLDEEIEKRRNLEQKVAYMQGLLEAGKTATPQPATEAPPVESKIAALDGALKDARGSFDSKELELAEAFDRGDLTMAQFKTQERQLQMEYGEQVRRLSLQRKQIVDSIPQAVENQIQQVNATPSLVSQTEALRAANPWLESISQEAFDMLREKAQAHLDAKYNGRVPLTPHTTFELRSAIVQLGRSVGFDRLSGTQQQPIQQPIQQITAEQRKEKLDLAKKQPPVLATTGISPGADTTIAGTQYTSADVDKMSELELSYLPKAVLERMVGMTK